MITRSLRPSYSRRAPVQNPQRVDRRQHVEAEAKRGAYVKPSQDGTYQGNQSGGSNGVPPITDQGGYSPAAAQAFPFLRNQNGFNFGSVRNPNFTIQPRSVAGGQSNAFRDSLLAGNRSKTGAVASNKTSVPVTRKAPSVLQGSLYNLISRFSFAEGGPVDTYPNVEDPEALEASQVPDSQAEAEYIGHVAQQSLQPDEVKYLATKLDKDPQLGMIVEKLILSGSEFSGAGPVEGPGTGVSDSIPARLSDGEFVFTDKATEYLGPENLQSMMDEAEKAYDGGLIKQETTTLRDDVDRMMLNANKMPSVSNITP